METNTLGKSIVKAAWIIGVTMVICMANYWKGQQRYTSLNDTFYIDQTTGKVMAIGQEYQRQNQ
jgi:hypothetical protein